MAQVATCLETTDYLAVAESIDADLTVVGPETPLAAGIVDQFRAKRRRVVGPTAAAARVESSKTFAKELMLRAGIPTARFATATNAEEARDCLLEFDLPVVIKADGLAAGKGVIIANTHQEARLAIDQLGPASGDRRISFRRRGELHRPERRCQRATARTHPGSQDSERWRPRSEHRRDGRVL